VAVHRRVYQPLSVGLTPAWSRFLVLPRHAWRSLAGSRLLVGFFVFCFVAPLVAAGIIYLFNNPLAQSLLGMDRGLGGLLAIDGNFFFRLLTVQGSLAFVLTAWVGPGLVTPDLGNGALPLYLCRPFSRGEYVLGRFATLFLLLSAITWVPDLLLFGLQAGLAAPAAAGAPGWWRGHLFIPGALIAGASLFNAVMALLALALSAYVRWRIVATGLFAASFFVSHGFGHALNQVLRTYWGNVLDLTYVVTTIWRDLFDVAQPHRTRRADFGDPTSLDVPTGFCWLMLLVVAAFSLYLLDRRLRAREVVRG
jgi:ABC-2 type transport system permease protein